MKEEEHAIEKAREKWIRYKSKLCRELMLKGKKGEDEVQTGKDKIERGKVPSGTNGKSRITAHVLLRQQQVENDGKMVGLKKLQALRLVRAFQKDRLRPNKILPIIPTKVILSFLSATAAQKCLDRNIARGARKEIEVTYNLDKLNANQGSDLRMTRRRYY